MPTGKPAASSTTVSRRMSRQRTRDTGTELALRRILWSAGYRYRVHYRPLRGLRREVDVAFVGARVAVLVDGCFWHGCTTHRSIPAANYAWWSDKIGQNIDRDRDTDRRLVEAGWHVIRVWEHDDAANAAARIQETVDKVRGRA